MAFQPENVSASFFEAHPIVMLHGAIPTAERDYARDHPSRELLEKLYAGVFEAGKVELDAAITGFLKRIVRGSRISIAPVLGDAILVFVIGHARSAKDMQPPGEPNRPPDR